jgi:hypothetical protein
MGLRVQGVCRAVHPASDAGAKVKTCQHGRENGAFCPYCMQAPGAPWQAGQVRLILRPTDGGVYSTPMRLDRQVGGTWIVVDGVGVEHIADATWESRLLASHAPATRGKL